MENFMKKPEIQQIIYEEIKKVLVEKLNNIYLSELIDMINDSLKKTPKVKNYNQLKSLLPQLESMLKNKGDISMPLSGLNNVLNMESKKKITERTNPDLIRLHKAKDQKEYDSIVKDLKKSSNWSENDIEYMLKKYRKDIKYSGPKFYSGEINKVDKVVWNEKSYNKWIKDVASGGGVKHSFDMAQNAKHQPGLLDFVKKKIRQTGGDETPLERIQWDIEVYA